MALKTWPTDIPDCPQTWNETPIEVRVRTDVDTGPAKVRRRFTKSLLQVEWGLTMAKDKYAIWQTFFEVTLRNGIDTFMYPHPYTGVDIEMRFAGVPQIQMGPTAFQISCTMEQVN